MCPGLSINWAVEILVAQAAAMLAVVVVLVAQAAAMLVVAALAAVAAPVTQAV